MFWNIFKSKKKEKVALPAIGFAEPFYYEILIEEDKNNMAEINSDFCVINHEDQTDRFIRGVLSIKVNDTNDFLDYGIWVSLSEKSFEDYESIFKIDAEERIYFGMISNEISDYEESTLGLHVNVVTRNDETRPMISLHEGSHALIDDYENGISLKEAQLRIEKLSE